MRKTIITIILFSIAALFTLLLSLTACKDNKDAQGQTSVPTAVLVSEAAESERTSVTVQSEAANIEPTETESEHAEALVTPEPMDIESVLLTVPIEYHSPDDGSEVLIMPSGWDYEGSGGDWNEVEVADRFIHKLPIQMQNNEDGRYSINGPIADWGAFGENGAYLLSRTTRCLFVSDENGTRIIDLPKELPVYGYELAANVGGEWYVLVDDVVYSGNDYVTRQKLVKLNDDGSAAEVFNCPPTVRLDVEATAMYCGGDGFLHLTVYAYNEEPTTYYYYVFNNGEFSLIGSEPAADTMPPEMPNTYTNDKNSVNALSSLMYRDENGCSGIYLAACQVQSADDVQVLYHYVCVLSYDNAGNIAAGMDSFDYLDSAVLSKNLLHEAVKADSLDSVLVLGIYGDEVRIQRVALRPGFTPDYYVKKDMCIFTKKQLGEMGLLLN